MTILLLAGAGSATQPTVPAHAFDSHVFTATSDGVTGNTAAVTLAPPWNAATGLEPVGARATVRHFFGRHYVVNRDAGTVQIIDPETFDVACTGLKRRLG